MRARRHRPHKEKYVTTGAEREILERYGRQIVEAQHGLGYVARRRQREAVCRLFCRLMNEELAGLSHGGGSGGERGSGLRSELGEEEQKIWVRDPTKARRWVNQNRLSPTFPAHPLSQGELEVHLVVVRQAKGAAGSERELMKYGSYEEDVERALASGGAVVSAQEGLRARTRPHLSRRERRLAVGTWGQGREAEGAKPAGHAEGADEADEAKGMKQSEGVARAEQASEAEWVLRGRERAVQIGRGGLHEQVLRSQISPFLSEDELLVARPGDVASSFLVEEELSDPADWCGD